MDQLITKASPLWLSLTSLLIPASPPCAPARPLLALAPGFCLTQVLLNCNVLQVHATLPKTQYQRHPRYQVLVLLSLCAMCWPLN